MDVWLQILLFSLGISIFSQLLNKLMKIDPNTIKSTQSRLKQLYQELEMNRNSHEINISGGNSPRSNQEINQELFELTKKMTKEQLLPTCLRCGIFWVIYAILGFLYGQYTEGVIPFPMLFFGSGWVGAYFLFSLIFGFGFYGLQRLYRKITHREQNVISTEKPGLGTESRISWKDRLNAVKKELK